MPCNYQNKAISKDPKDKINEVLEFRNITFGYDEKKPILKNVSLKLIKGKTYALVGPTGGGKSTTASLMARLYDPQEGVIELFDEDIRNYDFEDLTSHIGFILQEPFLFTGKIFENIIYGNTKLENISEEELEEILEKEELLSLLDSFEDKLKTKVEKNGEGLSLGQKQITAFIRAVLRKPSLLILDEATANIDTVTESILEKIINKLPKETTKVIIAHRLNTIKNADEIIFISNGRAEKAIDFKDAQKMIQS